MKKYLFFFLLIIPVLGFCQDTINAEQYLFSAQGNFDVSDQMTVSWTMGDFLTETVFLEKHISTQGFHQPIVLKETLVPNLNFENGDLLKTSEINFEIFPNPSNGVFNVQMNADTKTMSYEVYDATAKLLFVQLVSDDYFEIDLSSFGQGMYFLRMSDANGQNQTVSKLIKK